MNNPRRTKLLRTTVAIGVLGAFSLAATACSPAAQQNQGASGDKVVVKVRVWDEQVQKAYDKSFEEFEKANPNIDAQTVYVPYDSYFDKLRTDVAGGQGDDAFMINGSYIEPYIANGTLMEIGDDFDSSDWLEAAVKQYTYDGKLYGVPQLTDGGIALYYNEDLLSKAGLKPEDLQNLKWSPDGNGDTLTPTAKKLTVDAAGVAADQPGFNGDNPGAWGYSAAQDLQGIYYNFIGSNGGQFQDDNDKFVFASPESTQAFEYLVKLINTDKVSPAASNTNDDGDFTKDQFLQGKIAMFQSGTYNLKNVAEGAKFKWGIAPLPAGPAGQVSVVNSIITAGNAKSAHPEETKKVLQWLGSADGAKFIGAEGAALPAVKSAQPAYNDYWKAQDVDPSQFAKQGEMKALNPPAGSNYSAAFNAWQPIFNEIFLGRTPVGPGLKQAEDAANKAMGG